MDAAVLALAFTPDGAFVAATTNSHILIWNMADPSFPRARWVRGQEPGWQSPKTNGAALEEYHHCLVWDSDGKRLAYGVNSMVSYPGPRYCGTETNVLEIACSDQIYTWSYGCDC